MFLQYILLAFGSVTINECTLEKTNYPNKGYIISGSGVTTFINENNAIVLPESCDKIIDSTGEINSLNYRTNKLVYPQG